VTTGATVFALGNVPIGRVDLVYENSSRIILFSNPGEKTSVDINDTTFELVGRGGGNFEMNLPRDIDLQKGAQAVLPRVTPHVVATVETIISDPRDAFKKALLVSPVNIKELRFVEIEK
jgi:cell shape-determining protein MreC